MFFPFVKPDVVKRGVESMWNIQNDRAKMALAMTMTDKPTIVWDFYFLMLGIQMMFSIMLTDTENPSASASIVCRPLCQAILVRYFVAHSVRISIMCISAKRRIRRIDGMVIYND